MSKPFIGLNADFRNAQKDMSALSYICAGYYDAISEAGGVPLVIPPLNDDDDVCAVLDRLDGVLLIGGADLDPRRDGFMTHPTVRPMAKRREDFDRRLIKLVAERRMPVMGIGVGMQLLNVSQGGTLFLHIPEDLPKALPHADSQCKAHRHTLEVTPGTIMERVYGDGEIRVNSMHHMAIDDVAEGFIVSARCPDGVIECIESDSDDWFAFGTQFHPEAETASALDVRIFEEFLDGVKSAQPHALRVAA
jgi:putative glutamine amidotransferase